MLEFHLGREKAVATLMATEATHQQSVNFGCIVEDKNTHRNHNLQKRGDLDHAWGLGVCASGGGGHLTSLPSSSGKGDGNNEEGVKLCLRFNSINFCNSTKI